MVVPHNSQPFLLTVDIYLSNNYREAYPLMGEPECMPSIEVKYLW